MRHLFIFVAIATLALPFAATAQDWKNTPRIVVTGHGETAIAPDMAILTLSVLREEDTARRAVSANNEAMASVIKAMKAAGIADRDLQTSGFSISPRYVYPKENDRRQDPVIVAYAVTNTLVVRVRDLSKVGEVLDTSVSLGVNQGGDIRFTNDDPSAAITASREKAVADALAKANTLSRAAGVATGRILEISEQSHTPGPVPMVRARAMAMEAADAVPVQSGENTYRVQVHVTFEIAQ